MHFSTPVQRITSRGDITFTSTVAMSIMRGSENHELAWDFVRFCMEITDSLIDGVGFQYGGFPINRARFDNWTYDIIMQVGYRPNNVESLGQWIIAPDVPISDIILAAVDSYRALLEMVNKEDRRNWAVFNSLIYPDLYLFYQGRQNVDQTLINIQDRLELFVHE